MSRRAYDTIRRVAPAVVRLSNDQGQVLAELVVPTTGAKWPPVLAAMTARPWALADALDAGGRILASWTPDDLQLAPAAPPAAPPAAAPGAAPAPAAFGIADVLDLQLRTLQLFQTATSQRDQALLHLVKLSVERSHLVEQSLARLAGALERQALRHSEQLGQLQVVPDDDDSGPSLVELGAQLLPVLMGGASDDAAAPASEEAKPG